MSVLWKKWDGSGAFRKHIDAEQDELFYYREYTARKGYSYSDTNKLIQNFKIGPRPANHYRLKYRKEAIATFISELRPFLTKINADVWITWIPPSQSPDDPDYDDRLSQVVLGASKGLRFMHPVDVIHTSETRPRIHFDELARDPEKLAATYAWSRVDLTAHQYLLVVDDVLTQGTNFTAMTDTVKQRYPSIITVGVIWAFTVWADEEEEEPF